MSEDSETEVQEASPEAQSFYLRAKSVATLVTALTALILAVSGILRPQDQTVTKAVYSELAEATKRNSLQIQHQHDDLTALRAWLEGYEKAQHEIGTGTPAPPPVSPKPVPVAPKSFDDVEKTAK